MTTEYPKYVCPACKSDEVHFRAPEVAIDPTDGRRVIYVPAVCFNCESTWREIWELAAYDKLKVGMDI